MPKWKLSKKLFTTEIGCKTICNENRPQTILRWRCSVNLFIIETRWKRIINENRSQLRSQWESPMHGFKQNSFATTPTLETKSKRMCNTNVTGMCCNTYCNTNPSQTDPKLRTSTNKMNRSSTDVKWKSVCTKIALPANGPAIEKLTQIDSHWKRKRTGASNKNVELHAVEKCSPKTQKNTRTNAAHNSCPCFMPLLGFNGPIGTHWNTRVVTHAVRQTKTITTTNRS